MRSMEKKDGRGRGSEDGPQGVPLRTIISKASRRDLKNGY
jgi:hypothetical protein